MLICNDMKAIKYLFSILTVALVFSSCVDYSDASEAVTAKVQLQLPDELNGHMTLEGHTVSLQLNGVTYSTQTDAAGVATFSNIVPDVYNISASWDITSSEYNRITGSSQVINGATVSGSLNSQLINGSEPLLLTTTLSVKRDIVISKIYAAGSKDNNNKRYVAGQYIELYNQSNDSVDVAGLYIGLLETDVPQAYTLENLKTNYADSVVLVKQVFRIPTDKSYKVAPGGTVLLVNSAIDHSLNSPLEHSLLNANFEAKDVKGKILNNPEVPALQNVFNIYSGISYMNILTTGQGVVIFRSSADISQLKLTYSLARRAVHSMDFYQSVILLMVLISFVIRQQERTLVRSVFTMTLMLVIYVLMQQQVCRVRLSIVRQLLQQQADIAFSWIQTIVLMIFRCQHR